MRCLHLREELTQIVKENTLDYSLFKEFTNWTTFF